jgi:hypothetical protein
MTSKGTTGFELVNSLSENTFTGTRYIAVRD